MSTTYGRSPANLSAYRSVGAYGQVEAADPHRLIQVMLDTTLERIAAARGCMERGEVAAKGENIGKAINLVGALDASLDLERGGEIAVHLRELYDYSARRLLAANVANDPSTLDEVASLLREIKAAWDALPQAAAP